MNALDAYSSSYEAARARFRELAYAAGAVLEQHPVSIANTPQEALTVDVATIGSNKPEWAVVISSGLHGIEGFLGSAAQLAWLNRSQSLSGAKDGEGRFVLIHAINPYGFRELRRTNEDNVDLNRNFLDEPADFRGAPDGYRALDSLLNPASPPSPVDPFYLKALWHVWRAGLPALKESIAGGQYEYARGLFYGGSRLAQSANIILENFGRWTAGATDVLHIDFHTGLGKYGAYTLLVVDAPDSPALDWYRKAFGENVVEAVAQADGTAYKLRGTMAAALAARFAGSNYRCVGAEFGAYPVLRVLAAMRAENRAHFYSRPGETFYRRAKAELLECFCPSDAKWRETALHQALRVIDQGIASAPFRP